MRHPVAACFECTKGQREGLAGWIKTVKRGGRGAAEQRPIVEGKE
jgi:hypothetical protein